jgi:diguanylate cyclase (GGDEF)-like protein/PAS domain S-box-containing protein
MIAPLPPNESQRLAALDSYNILDTPAEVAFDEITQFVAELFDMPICAVSLVAESRQWFKSIVGLDATETPRDVAFCAHTILRPKEVMVVENALTDKRFYDNALVTGDPSIRFYAGAPLTNSEGHALGSLCVIDSKPRVLTDIQERILQKFASQIVSQLELRKALAAQKEIADSFARSEERLFRAQTVSGTGSWEFDLLSKEIRWSLKTFEIFAIDPSRGAPNFETLLKRHHPVDAEILRKAVAEAIEFGRPYQIDLRVKRGEGFLHVQANGEVVFDENSNPGKLVGTIVDISARKYAEVRLHQHAMEVERLLQDVKSTAARAEEMAEMYQFSAKRFVSLFSGLPVACMGLDLAGKVMEWNKVSETLFGYTAGEALFQDAIELLIPKRAWKQARAEFEATLKNSGRSETREEGLVNKDGKMVWVLTTSLPLLDSRGILVGIIITNVDISDRKRFEAELMETRLQIEEQHQALEFANEALEALATSDGLTGLKNHRAFQDYLSASFDQAVSTNGQLGLILIDVDHFKTYNDTYGHPAGDFVLKKVAGLFKEAVADKGLAARYGGEEFAAVIAEKSPKELARVAEHIRASIESADWPDRSITVSVGTSYFQHGVTSKAELIQMADQALYQSKGGGRNRVTSGQLPKKAA